jgi:hypothetical protein
VWTFVGTASKAAQKSQRAEVVPCEAVCKLHVAQFVLTLFSPNADQINFSAAGKPFSKLVASGGSGAQ